MHVKVCVCVCLLGLVGWAKTSHIVLWASSFKTEHIPLMCFSLLVKFSKHYAQKKTNLRSPNRVPQWAGTFESTECAKQQAARKRFEAWQEGEDLAVSSVPKDIQYKTQLAFRTALYSRRPSVLQTTMFQ